MVRKTTRTDQSRARIGFQWNRFNEFPVRVGDFRKRFESAALLNQTHRSIYPINQRPLINARNSYANFESWSHESRSRPHFSCYRNVYHVNYDLKVSLKIIKSFKKKFPSLRERKTRSYCKGCWWRLFGGGAAWAVDVAGALALLTRCTCNWCICSCAASSPRKEHLEHCRLLCTFSTWVARRSARAALYSQRVHAKGLRWVFRCRFRHQLSTPLQEQ